MKLIGYRIQQESNYGHLRVSDYHALDYHVIFPTIEAAEAAVVAICEAERDKITKKLKATTPCPAAIKKAWDDKVGAAAIVEERITEWDVRFSREKREGSSSVSNGSVLAKIEQREAWRDIKQITRTGANGLEVVHELGKPGKWSEWHESPMYGERTSVSSLVFDILPVNFEMVATPEQIRAWMRKQGKQASKSVKSER